MTQHNKWLEITIIYLATDKEKKKMTKRIFQVYYYHLN